MRPGVALRYDRRKVAPPHPCPSPPGRGCPDISGRVRGRLGSSVGEHLQAAPARIGQEQNGRAVPTKSDKFRPSPTKHFSHTSQNARCALRRCSATLALQRCGFSSIFLVKAMEGPQGRGDPWSPPSGPCATQAGGTGVDSYSHTSQKTRCMRQPRRARTTRVRWRLPLSCRALDARRVASRHRTFPITRGVARTRALPDMRSKPTAQICS